MEIIQGSIIMVMIKDMDRSIGFYTEMLGLKMKVRYGDHWAEIEAPELRIGLHPTTKPIVVGNNLQIGLSVTDLDSAVKSFQEKGIEFERRDDQNVRLASFKDPDGNVLYLSQSD